MEISSQEESNNSDTSSDGSFYELAGLGAALGAYAAGRYCEQHPLSNSQPPLLPRVTCRQWVEVNLHDRLRCHRNFRMFPEDFIQLHGILVADHGLKSSQEFSSVEALAMFLRVCGTGQSFRNIKDRFARSFDTISRKMAHVLNCMFSFAQVVIAPKDATYSQLHPRLHRYSPFFDGCIGALDETHIPARIKQGSRLDYLNRKGWTSFNVLDIVDLDMRFTYVGAGRAGSCHDMSVLCDCMETPNYPHPPQGYALRRGYLGPYRSTRYHLDEFSQRGAETSEEKFNYHHSSIRNVVERTFGVLKSRWHILQGIPFYTKKKQIQIIIACCALHNYLVQLRLSRDAQPNLPRAPKEASTMWVEASVSDDMSTVRD